GRGCPRPLILALSFNSSSEADLKQDNIINIAAVNPWIAVIASFIGGNNVNVTSVYDFNFKLNKNLDLNNYNYKVIAVDSEDAKRISVKQGVEVWYLFKDLSLNIEAAVLDPSMTPFVAQKVMTALATWDAGNYNYYQRRLAEFQTRLSSSVLVGKQLLNGSKIYINLEDESAMNLYNLFIAAGCEILSGDLNSSQAVVVTANYNKPAKRKVKNLSKNIFEFKRPEVLNAENSYNIDYPAYLHDLYIALWNIINNNKAN
nr:hypothetical protein [Synergistaceae bacterium]